MSNPERYTITAALPYANGPLHIGHLAGVYVPADIYVRYLRLQKRDVLFVCGSDEHGAAITLRAKKEGVSPQEIVDKYHSIIERSFKDFGINFDIYHRTSSPLHHETAQDFFTKLHNKGSFDVKTSQQFYDTEQQQFLADRYIMGTCPVCSFENAYGDQCENCGSSLNPQELKNPRSVISGNTPVLKDTTLWYLPMEKHENWLKQWITEGILDGKQQHDPTEWKKQVLGQCRSWIDGGLQSRAMTRDLDWGVPVPLDNAEGKVLYVWLDAPIGYISATKQWAINNAKDWKPYWQDKGTKLVHFLAKDNIVFHCIIFPIILKEHGDYILPDNIPANEFLNLEGNKISTSRNWAVWLHEYLEDFGGKQDELRYVLNAIAPEFRDSEFTWADYQARVNNELVAVLGNFVNRTLVLTQKYYEGVTPQRGDLNNEDNAVLKQIGEIPGRISDFIEKYRFRDAQQEAMQLARAGNKYLAETEPWKLIKTDPERVKTILNVCLQLCANISIVFEPFLPVTCASLQGMLNFSSSNWTDAGKTGLIEEGHKIGKSGLLFERIEDSMVEQQVAKLEASKVIISTKTKKPAMPEVSYDEFMKMDIRVGEILEAERVPKTDKLLKLLIDTGLDRRTVVSGIAEYYKPEEIIGKQVSLLMNLAPRKIKGIESQGMILMAANSDGKLSFVSPETGFEVGSEIR